jgi:hypothetical protein
MIQKLWQLQNSLYIFYFTTNEHHLIGRVLILSWAFYDLQGCEYSKRTELLISWAMQNVTFILVINTWTPLLEPRTARVKLPELWIIYIRKFCFIIITQTFSSLMESMATHETSYYITVNPNVKNRSTEFNEWNLQVWHLKHTKRASGHDWY